MRQTDKQIDLYKSMTTRQFRAKYKPKKKRYSKKRKTTIKNISQWRTAVLKRDDYTCQDCGLRKRKGNHAHHIIPKSEKPELKFDLDNGETLCKDCHNKIHHGLIDYYEQQEYLRQIVISSV